MRKVLLLLVAVAALGCTNQKVVQYNTNRLDHIEEYLQENRVIKINQNLDNLIKEEKIEYSEEFKSLEKEAEAWLENQQQK